MFPENITHYPGYGVYYFPPSRNVFILHVCTGYIVRVCLLSFIKIIYTYMYIYMHTYMLLEIDFHSVLVFLMLLRVM